jgi:hypothetical protein
MADDSADRPDTGDTLEEKIVKQAKREFKRCQDWESTARKRFVEDVRFANGDSDNLWQWDNDIRGRLKDQDAPCLTINKIRQHNKNILNDARQNRPGVKVKAVGGGASYEAAKAFEGVVRRIEYLSNASAAYDTAMKFQVDGGIGYILLATEFAGDDTFDQDVFIRRVSDPLTVYLDPDAKEADKSDAKFGFAFDDMARDEFEKRYPKYKDMAASSPLGDTDYSDWVSDKKVRVCRYYRCVQKKDRLIGFKNPADGQNTTVRVSKVPKAILDLVTDDPETRTRDIVETTVDAYLIIGDSIAEKKEWLGKYIPIIPVIGEEIVVEGQMDRWGHTRAAKDPQRIYNYWSSSAVKQVALQTKAPFVGPMAAFEGYETYYEDANKVDSAWLPYNGYDDQGRPLNPPQRSQPPVMAQAYLQGMQVASDELQAVSGQFQADMGMESNEKSGVAIRNRQRVGDLATVHYIDNLRMAIRYVGKQLVDLIPKIYDTERVIKILAEDGTEQEIRIDPAATEAYFEDRKTENDAVKSIFNPSVGRYEVVADTGPGFATRRQETFDALMQIATQSPEVMRIAGDLVFQASDIDMADELAERFRKVLPPEVTGDALPPQAQQQLMQAQKQIQGLSTALAAQVEKSAKLALELKGKDQQKDIDVFYAETDRLKALSQALPMDPQGLQQLVHQLVIQSLQTTLGPVLAASAPELRNDALGGSQEQTPAMPMPQQAPQAPKTQAMQ